MGLRDRGAHSQPETPILRGQSGESTAPRTKGLLSPKSHHLISCPKNALEYYSAVSTPRRYTYRKASSRTELLPLEFKYSSIQL